MWPLLYQAFNEWAFDYFENILVPLDNFISRGTAVFLSSQNPNYLNQVPPATPELHNIRKEMSPHSPSNGCTCVSLPVNPHSLLVPAWETLLLVVLTTPPPSPGPPIAPVMSFSAAELPDQLDLVHPLGCFQSTVQKGRTSAHTHHRQELSLGNPACSSGCYWTAGICIPCVLSGHRQTPPLTIQTEMQERLENESCWAPVGFFSSCIMTHR